jgi:serine/threonine protein phosphatase PrpC
MKFSIFQASRQGGRKYNQDRVAYSYSKDALLMVLADGMGGHFYGEIAAQITVQMLAENFQKQAKPAIKDPPRFLHDSILAAHDAIVHYTAVHDLVDSPRTTCVACVVQNEAATWAHVGDSRLYHFRNGKMLARTKDHSKVQQLFDMGRIKESEMLTHPERNKIYNCLGGIIKPDVEISPRAHLQGGDAILICTDGVWSQLAPDEIGAILKNFVIAQAIPELLDHAEFRAGADSDNLSAVGLQWPSQGNGGVQQGAVSTETLPMHAKTTQMESFDKSLVKEPDMMSDDEVEKAIREIQATIRKYSK